MSEAPRKSIVFNGVLTLFMLWDSCGNSTLLQDKQLEPEAGLSPHTHPCGPQYPGPLALATRPPLAQVAEESLTVAEAGKPGAQSHSCHLLLGQEAGLFIS